MDTDGVRFKDFSISWEPVTFKMEDDTFECLPEIPLDAVIEMATLASGTDRAQQMRQVFDFFDGIMTPESAAKLRERSAKGSLQPIGMRLITQVIPWLMEVYGMRPTQPSSDSPAGSDDTGMSSTAGA